MKNFTFEKIIIYSITREDVTRFCIEYSRMTRKTNFEKVLVKNPEQFRYFKKYLRLRKNLSFRSFTSGKLNLLTGETLTVTAVFAAYNVFGCGLVAISDFDAESFYHLPDGKIYTKEALFNMYKMKEMKRISDKIEQLSSELITLANETI